MYFGNWSNIKKRHVPSNQNDFVRCYLWQNDLFKIGGEEFLFKDWQKAGINFVNDLFHNVKKSITK